MANDEILIVEFRTATNAIIVGQGAASGTAQVAFDHVAGGHVIVQGSNKDLIQNEVLAGIFRIRASYVGQIEVGDTLRSRGQAQGTAISSGCDSTDQAILSWEMM